MQGGRSSIPLRGAQWMVAAATCWTIINLFMKIAAEGMHPFQVAFFRSIFALGLLLPWMAWKKEPIIPRKRFGLVFSLAAVQTLATLSWVLAMKYIPLVEATALGFTTPFFGTVLAAVFLGERIRIRRITALTIGFAGVLVVLGLETATLDPYAVAALTCALCAAGYGVLMRRLSTEFHANTLVSYVFIFMLPLTAVTVIPVWQTPTWNAIYAVIVVAVIGTAGHLAMARAWASAEIAVVAPFDYVQIALAAAIGYFILSEEPGWNVWAGAAIIIGSAIYIARREAFLARAHVPHAPLQDRPPATHP
jgi:drug/metabolite transporter (DMT)-like permease